MNEGNFKFCYVKLIREYYVKLPIFMKFNSISYIALYFLRKYVFNKVNIIEHTTRAIKSKIIDEKGRLSILNFLNDCAP